MVGDLPGAVDRLRRVSDDEPAVLLATADPANAYGAALAWPDSGAGRPSRSAGSYLVLIEGAPVVYLERGARRALTFTGDEEALSSAAARLAEVAGSRLRRMELETVDAEPAGSTPLSAYSV